MYPAGCLGQMLHVAGIVQGHELLIGIHIRAIALSPLRLPVDLLRQRRVVACRLQHTYLVLYLHHDDHLALRVTRLDMLHQRREGLQIGLQHVVAEARCYLQGLTIGGHRPRESLRVLFEPTRRITRHRVLPHAEPQEHHVQLLAPRHIDGAVDEGEVESSLLRFHQFPVGRHEHRVQSQRPHPRHHRLDVSRRCGSRVTQFSSQNGEIHHGRCPLGSKGQRAPDGHKR